MSTHVFPDGEFQQQTPRVNNVTAGVKIGHGLSVYIHHSGHCAESMYTLLQTCKFLENRKFTRFLKTLLNTARKSKTVMGQNALDEDFEESTFLRPFVDNRTYFADSSIFGVSLVLVTATRVECYNCYRLGMPISTSF